MAGRVGSSRSASSTSSASGIRSSSSTSSTSGTSGTTSASSTSSASSASSTSSTTSTAVSSSTGCKSPEPRCPIPLFGSLNCSNSHTPRTLRVWVPPRVYVLATSHPDLRALCRGLFPRGSLPWRVARSPPPCSPLCTSPFEGTSTGRVDRVGRVGRVDRVGRAGKVGRVGR